MVETSAVTLITPRSEENDFRVTPSRESLVPARIDPFPYLRHFGPRGKYPSISPVASEKLTRRFFGQLGIATP